MLGHLSILAAIVCRCIFYFLVLLCTVYHTDQGASVLGSLNGFFTYVEPLLSACMGSLQK